MNCWAISAATIFKGEEMIRTWFEHLGRQVIDTLSGLGRFAFFCRSVIGLFLTSWPRRSLIVRQMYLIGVLSLPVVLITGAFTGMVLTVQSFYQLRQFTLETVVPSIVGLSMTRELGPVLTGLMLAGRVGAAMAAELGTMKVTEQIDALTSLATNPLRYLVVPRFIACVTLIPFLTVCSVFVGILGAYLIGVKLLGIPHVFFMENLRGFIVPEDVFSGLIKTVFFGALITLVSCYKGFYARNGAEGVGISATQAVVLSSIAILVSDFFLSLILF